MKKFLSLLAVALLATTLFAGCASATPTTAPTSPATTATPVPLSGKIVFATWRTDKADNTLTDLANAFTALHPGTMIEVDPVKDETTISTQMAAGEAPDVYMLVPGIKQADYPKYFAPLDALGYTKTNAFVREGQDGKVYGLVSSVNYDGIVYSKKAFAAAGITKVPTTLEELYADCAIFKAKGIVPMASNFKDSWPMVMYTYFYATGVSGNGDFLNNTVSTDLLATGSPMLDGLNVLRTLNVNGYLDADLTSTNWDQTKKDIATGKTAMTYIQSWYAPQVIDAGAAAADIGMFPFPGVKALVASADQSIVINANTKSLDLSMAFLKYMWEDSRYQVATGVLSPILGTTPTDPYALELLSYKLTPVLVPDNSDNLSAVISDMQLDWGKLCQEYLLAKDPSTVVAAYNQKWADSKTKVIK